MAVYSGYCETCGKYVSSYGKDTISKTIIEGKTKKKRILFCNKKCAKHKKYNKENKNDA